MGYLLSLWYESLKEFDMAKMNWSFRSGEMREECGSCVSYCRDGRKSVVISGDGYEMVMDKHETIELPDGYEGYKVLSFYCRDMESVDLVPEAADDLRGSYQDVVGMLDLYEHVPTFDDSKAGKVFCAGESVGFFGNYLVITASYRLDM